MCDSNGGKAPASYVPEYTKIKTAWDTKHKVTRDKKPTHLKVLEDEAGNNTEEEDDPGTEDEFGMAMVTQSLKLKAGNSVAAPANASPQSVSPSCSWR